MVSYTDGGLLTAVMAASRRPCRAPSSPRNPPALCALPIAQELSGGPPAGFTLTESKGDTLMSLSKDFRGEKVAVDVMVNDQVRCALPFSVLPPGCLYAVPEAVAEGKRKQHGLVCRGLIPHIMWPHVPAMPVSRAA